MSAPLWNPANLLKARTKRTGRPPIAVEPFTISKDARKIAVADLPLSKRLTVTFARMNLRRLGDIDGLDPSAFSRYIGCGKNTLADLRALVSRANRGEFTAGLVSDRELRRDLIPLLHEAITHLDPTRQYVLFLRIGGRTDEPKTLIKIARRLGTTKQAVRAILLRAADEIRRMWGPRIPRLLARLRRHCRETGSSLTPELLAQWQDAQSRSSQLAPIMYVRLIGLLDKTIPYGFGAKANRSTIARRRSRASILD